MVLFCSDVGTLPRPISDSGRPLSDGGPSRPLSEITNSRPLSTSSHKLKLHERETEKVE